jgi:hypothetical protein
MLSTKDVKTGGDGGTPKTITPGNHTLKVNAIELKQFPFMEKDNAYFINLNVETKPIEGFEGFWINKDDESLGRHEGQVGTVKSTRWFYKDGETKSGTPISRDTEILKFVKNLCNEAGCDAWFKKADDQYETIEEFVDGFNSDKPFADKWLDCCVAGKEYHKSNGYIGYDMYFAKYAKGVKGFASEGSTNVHEYNENEFLIKAEAPAKVEGFGGEEAPLMDKVANAPEFDL